MEFEFIQIVILCALIFLGGFIDSIAGGGGLISLPAYVLTGVPMHSALASNKFSSTFGTAFSAWNFLRNGKVYVKAIPVSVVFALAGSAFGAYIALLTSDEVLRNLLLVMIPIIAVIVIVKRDFGKENRMDTLKTGTILTGAAIAAGVIGFYDGFFGPGTGTFLILIFTIFLRFDLVTANGNSKIINLSSNLGSMVTFIISGHIVFQLAVPAAVFGILGNVIGSRLAIKIGAKIIKPVLIGVLTLLLFTLITRG
ncbi:MAG: TSUP family transporter [Defluviitaleaceae bacterium]|nr:TSUP family transporter [Defluviitaleaceae bacterium]